MGGGVDARRDAYELAVRALSRKERSTEELAGWGSERVREALLARGVAPEHIEAALADDSDAAQIDRAGELLVRRGRSLDSEADKTSALGYLTRRGYSYEVAYEAIRHRGDKAA